MRNSALLLVVPLLVSSASASTWVVDAAGAPGSQFTSIDAAIQASLPGDVVLVRDGTYSPFLVDRGVALVGGPGVLVVGDASVIGLPANERAAVVGFSVRVLNVANCLGPVIAQDIYSAGGVRVNACADVRFRSVTAQPLADLDVPGLRVEASRLEIVDSTVQGAPNSFPGPGPASDGWIGMWIQANSNVHALSSSFAGSAGQAIATQFAYGPNGASGITVQNSSLRIVGSHAAGGGPGINWFYSSCDHDGYPGNAIVSLGSTVAHSATTWFALPSPASQLHCWIVFGPVYFGGTGYQLVTPNDPQLRVLGTPVAGQVVTFEVSAPPGSAANLVLGRACVVNPTPPVYVEELSSRERGFSMGVVPASGKITAAYTIPSSLPQGFVLVAQAEVLQPGGRMLRTNSAPVVVR
jgi:hypothetical protein